MCVRVCQVSGSLGWGESSGGGRRTVAGAGLCLWSRVADGIKWTSPRQAFSVSVHLCGPDKLLR